MLDQPLTRWSAMRKHYANIAWLECSSYIFTVETHEVDTRFGIMHVSYYACLIRRESVLFTARLIE